MKKHWETLRIRLESLAVRERAMILAASALTLAFVLDALLIEPVLARHKAVLERLALQQNQIRQMQAAEDAVRQFTKDGENARIRARIERLKAELAGNDKLVRSRSEHLFDQRRITPLLERMLKSDRLVEFKTLPAAALFEPGTASSMAAPGIYKHAVRVSLRGSYQALLDYLAELEKEQVFWGEASIDMPNPSEAVMTLNVYTLSLDPAWLKLSNP